MQPETGEVPEIVETYLEKIPGLKMISVANENLSTSLGQFRAIGSLVLGEGWSSLESWGVWSDGDFAVVYLKNVLMAENSGSAETIGEVAFEARAAISEAHQKLSVRFQLGSSEDEFVFSWPAAVFARIKVPIPTELSLAPVLRVRIEVSGAKAPYEQSGGANPDHRRVGIGIVSVQVQPHREDRPGSLDAHRSDHRPAVRPAERPMVEPINGGKSNVIAITMVYNEGDALRRWIRHYGRHVGERNLLIIDDGSDDGSTLELGLAGRVSIPKKPFDDGERADFVNNIQQALLKYYDAVIYTDCDEFLVPDPRRFVNLREYVDQMTSDCVRPVAFNVIQIRHKESDLDRDRPILDQRKYCLFYTPECKPSLAKVPIRYTAGFHSCDRKVLLDPALMLVHSKLADFSAALSRLTLTRGIRWSDRSIRAGWGDHHRHEDNVLIGSFASAESFLRTRGSVEPLDPENLAAAVNAQMEEQGPPYQPQPFAGPLVMVPDWLRGTV